MNEFFLCTKKHDSHSVNSFNVNFVCKYIKVNFVLEQGSFNVTIIIIVILINIVVSVIICVFHFSDNIMNTGDCQKEERKKKKTRKKEDDPDYYNEDHKDFKFPEDFDFKKREICFDISVSKKEWNKIKPIPINYEEKKGKREYLLFQKGWTHLMAKKIWKKTDVPCAYSFKKGKQFKRTNFKYHLKCIGHCVECPSLIEITRETASTSFPIKLSVKTYLTHDLKHYKKRQASGTARKKAKKKLPYMSAKMFQAEQVLEHQSKSSNMDRSTGPCPLVWNLPVNRKIKQEYIDEKLKL